MAVLKEHAAPLAKSPSYVYRAFRDREPFRAFSVAVSGLFVE